MSVYKDTRTGNYCYKFKHGGVQYHRCFKGLKQSEVESLEYIARSELIKHKYDISANNKVIMLSELLDDYKSYVKNTYSRPDEAIFIVDNFYKLISNKPAEQVTLVDFEKYRTKRKNDGVKNSSINREMDNIKRIFSLAKNNRKIRFNPADDLKDLKIQNPTKRYLTKEEEKKLLNAANPIMKAIIIIAIHTGMRSSEIKKLKWSDVFIKQGYLIALNTKNGKSRELIITPQMKKELKKLPHLSEYVFTNPTTKQPYKDFKSTFARTVKAAKIPHITFHELRHTTASRLNEIGIDLATIQEYLDHADARTTQGYIHKPKKNIVDAINRLSQYK